MKLFLIFTFIIVLHLVVLICIKVKQEIKTTDQIVINLKRKSIKKKTDDKSQFQNFNSALFSNLKGLFVKNIKMDKEGSKKNKLYEYINEGLTFPSDFQKYSIQGVVKASLYFDKEGVFVMEKSLFHAKSGFLRFHIMSYIEDKLKTYKLGTKDKNGFIPMKFVFSYTVSGLAKNEFLLIDEFIFNREGFQTETPAARVLLEVGQTLVSLLNLLKFRPDFLKSNQELLKQQRSLHRLQKIRSHPYYR